MDMVETAIRRFQTEGYAIPWEQLSIYRRLGQGLRQGLRRQRVIDVGCGIGIGTNILAYWGCQVIGLDIEPKNVAFARALYPELNFAIWDISIGPIQAESDVIVAIELIEHVEDAARVVQNLLASAPYAYLSTPNRACPELGQDRPLNPFHVREYTPYEVLELIGRPTLIRDPFSWNILPPQTLMTPLVYEVKS
jgi:2-polyprenyl-3-methyl-5-hydroxy-6-metoxy-1,4-benzoquinol methylase